MSVEQTECVCSLSFPHCTNILVSQSILYISLLCVENTFTVDFCSVLKSKSRYCYYKCYTLGTRYCHSISKISENCGFNCEKVRVVIRLHSAQGCKGHCAGWQTKFILQVFIPQGVNPLCDQIYTNMIQLIKELLIRSITLIRV